MGSVYKAEDTRLRRTVALKFLARDLTGSGDYSERFLREARAAAALDHPNICTLYEIGQEDGETFLSMAFLEGTPLDSRIESGQLPLTEVYEVGRQAAEGLAAAHSAGVVHRDIKSSNIMVNEDSNGRPVVKLMDFGLAQVSGESKLTRLGTRMGTVAYMSPEQAQGEKVGRASDLWSLGVVLHEMVSGELPFKGHYDQAILYSVLNEDPPPLTTLRSGVPMELEWIVEKCLAKDPADRYREARELAVDLERLAQRSASGRTVIGEADVTKVLPPASERVPEAPGRAPGTVKVRPARRSRRSVLAGLGAAAILAAGFVAGYFSSAGEGSSQPTNRFTLRPAETARAGHRIRHVAVAPDGRTIAYCTAGADGTLWLQPLERHEPIQIEGVSGVRQVFWSPDSNFLGFVTTTSIGTVALRGLAVTVLVEQEPFLNPSAAWSADGQSILFTGRGARIFQVSAMGGQYRPLETGDGALGRSVSRSPTLIGCDNGSQILLYSQRTLDSEDIIARRIIDGEVGDPVRIVEGSGPSFAPSGHILYRPSISSAAIWAVPFSPDDLEVLGEPFLVAQDGFAPSVSRDGMLVYLDNPSTGQMRLHWLDSEGREAGVLGREQPWLLGPRLSPSGERVLVAAGQGRDFDLWVHEAGRSVINRLTFDDLDESGAIWAPDSRHVVVAQRGSADLKLYSVDGVSPARTLWTSPRGHVDPMAWSADGRYILIQLRAQPPPRGRAVPGAPGKAGFLDGRSPSTGLAYLERMDGGENGEDWEMREFIPVGPYLVDDGVFSPDGRYVAYESNEGGANQVYVRQFPEGTQRWQITTEGGVLPRWSLDGQELYFLRASTLFAVDIDTAAGFAIGEPRRLFAADSLLGLRRYPTYDVGPEGRFLTAKIQQGLDAPAIRIVQNWLSEFELP